MNPVYESLYKEMLKDIDRSMRLELPEPERVTNCFWIAANHWEELKKRICTSVFQDEKDEIDFFRNVKPKFTGYIQYFTIISEALLFIPEKKEEQFSYWEGEMKRYEWFCDKHSKFVKYYESRKHDLDKEYFIKAPKDWQPRSPMVTYDSDKEFCSSHDWLVRGILAHIMYWKYSRKRLKGLTPNPFPNGEGI